MKKIALAFTSIFLLISSTTQAQVQSETSSSIGLSNTGENLIVSDQQLLFQENKGQVCDQNYQARPDVLFSGQSNGMVFHLKNNGISYQLNRIDSYKEVKDERTSEVRQDIDQTTIYRIDINWLNTNSNTVVQKENVAEGFNNYYLEHCPNGALNVLSYENINYQNIYNGIDLKWYSKDGTLKYDYVVAAGADYQQIEFEIAGAESIVINEKGELEIKTPLGMIIEESPYVIQDGKELKSQWVINNNRIHFNIENIDESKPFIIDPAVRIWGTYYGGIGNDIGLSCTVSSLGEVYMSGYSSTPAITIIATTGSHQTTHGGNEDAFLVKFNPSGVRQWGTYYGGADIDEGHSCAVDASGNVYLAGFTTSNSGISTPGSHQSTYAGSGDGFLVKFNSSGVREWGTYYGGLGMDVGSGSWSSCAVDTFGNVYMVGRTGSTTSIATLGSHQATSGGGTNDGFLVKFNSTGVLQWGTYYGGVGDDQGRGCSFDATGNIYMVGFTNTNSGTTIATTGSHQSTNGGAYDGFLVKFNSSGVRQWGTYYGGALQDYPDHCSVDPSGNIYMGGYTYTTDGAGITTPGCHQGVYGGGSFDGFFVKFNSAGVRQWGTYYGGAGSDRITSSSTDIAGNVYPVGYSTSSGGSSIATAGSHQSLHGGAEDGILVKFNAAGVRQWGTYYGGTSSDRLHSIVMENSGNMHVAGRTLGSLGTSIATPGSHQSTFSNPMDAFLVKLFECVPNSTIDVESACDSFMWINGVTYSSSTSLPTITLVNMAGCDSVITLNLTITNSNSGTATISSCDPITWIDGNTYSTSNSIATHTLTNASGCDSLVTLNFTKLVPTSGTEIVSICDSYTWINGVTYTASTTTPTFTLTNVAGCDSMVTLNLTITNSNTGTDIQTACDSYTWINGITYTSSTSTPTFTLTNVAGCDSIVTLNLTITNSNSGAEMVTACDSYTWIDGLTYTANTNTPTFALTNSAGCDSVVTLNLTITNSNSGTDLQTACNNYTWINGITYTSNTNTPTFTLTNVAGCDSIVTLNLTINGVSDISTSVTGTTLTANNSAASYQWLDCNNSFAPISGQLAQTFSPSTNGNYAVQFTQNGCMDTSACTTINSIGFLENNFAENFTVYPNPTTGKLIIEFESVQQDLVLTLFSVQGDLIQQESFLNSSQVFFEIDAANGIYLLQITNSENQKAVLQIIKE